MLEKKKIMLLSSRANPPKYLTVPSRSNHSLKELLLHSPLPSPALPSILPRHGKKPPPINTRKVLRVLCWLAIITTLFAIFNKPKKTSKRKVDLVYENANGQSYRYVEDFDLPDYPSPLAVTDSAGESRWTIHIPTQLGFPLPQDVYEDICSHVPQVSSYVAEARGNAQQMSELKYYQPDTNYIDVIHAQLSDLLPFDPQSVPSGDVPLCKSSLIYVLDASDAGLGGSLLGLWLAYGLAKHEKREFFIDDSTFAYGRYSSLFNPPPIPKCKPPPPTQRVPCPHLSQHLVVTASTWKWTFGKEFHAKFNTKQIFQMMRTGYDALFKLSSEDQSYVDSRVAELKTDVGLDGMVIGMHVRRGDKHPEEFQYQHGYIPPTQYTSALKKMTTGYKNYTLVLASDDADMYHDTEFSGAVRAQEKITLASKKEIDSGGLGWERGFFKDAFWNLGLPEHLRKNRHLGSPLPTKDPKVYTPPKDKSWDENRDYRQNPTPQTMKLRSYIARAYLLDLAVLSQSDRLVCAVSSRGCRILGVMMGWDNVEIGHWKNIDGTSDWKGLQ